MVFQSRVAHAHKTRASRQAVVGGRRWLKFGPGWSVDDVAKYEDLYQWTG